MTNMDGILALALMVFGYITFSAFEGLCKWAIVRYQKQKCPHCGRRDWYLNESGVRIHITKKGGCYSHPIDVLKKFGHTDKA